MASRYSNADLRLLAQDVVKAISTSTSGTVTELLRIAEEMKDSNEALTKSLKQREKIEQKHTRLTEEWYDAKKRNKLRELELEAQYQKRMKRSVTVLDEFQGSMKTAVQKTQKTFMTLHGDLSKTNKSLLSSTSEMQNRLKAISSRLKEIGSSGDIDEIKKLQSEILEINEDMVKSAKKTNSSMRFSVEQMISSLDPTQMRSAVLKLQHNVVDLQDGILATSKSQKQNQRTIDAYNTAIQKAFKGQNQIINELTDIRDVRVFQDEMKQAGKLAKEFQKGKLSETEVLTKLQEMAMFKDVSTNQIIDAFKTGFADQLKQVDKQLSVLQQIRNLNQELADKADDAAEGGGITQKLTSKFIKLIPMGAIATIIGGMVGSLAIKVGKEIMNDQLAVMKYGTDMRGGVLSNMLAAGSMGINSGDYAKIRAENRGILSNYGGGEDRFAEDMKDLVTGRADIQYKGASQSVASMLGGSPEERVNTMVLAMQTLARSGLKGNKDNIMSTVRDVTAPYQDLTGQTQEQSFQFLNSIMTMSENQEMLMGLSEGQREAYLKNTMELGKLGEKMGLSAEATQAMVSEMVKARKAPIRDKMRAGAMLPIIGQILGADAKEAQSLAEAQSIWMRGGNLDQWMTQGNNAKMMQKFGAKIGRIQQGLEGDIGQQAVMESLLGKSSLAASLFSIAPASAREGGKDNGGSRTGAENQKISSAVLVASTVLGSMSQGMIHTLGAIDGQLDVSKILSIGFDSVTTAIGDGFDWLKKQMTGDTVGAASIANNQDYQRQLKHTVPQVASLIEKETKQQLFIQTLKQTYARNPNDKQLAIKEAGKQLGITRGQIESMGIKDLSSSFLQAKDPTSYLNETQNKIQNNLLAAQKAQQDNVRIMTSNASSLSMQDINKNKELNNLTPDGSVKVPKTEYDKKLDTVIDPNSILLKDINNSMKKNNQLMEQQYQHNLETSKRAQQKKASVKPNVNAQPT